MNGFEQIYKNIYPSLVHVQPRKIRPYITERLLMGRKESNQTKKQQQKHRCTLKYTFLAHTETALDWLLIAKPQLAVEISWHIYCTTDKTI